MKSTFSLLSLTALAVPLVACIGEELPEELDTQVGVDQEELLRFELRSRSRIHLDINDDGYDDLIVANSSYDEVYVFRGSPSGLPSSPSQTLVGPDGPDSIFSSISRAGDINHDGYGDLVIGANEANKAYLYFGGSSGLPSSPNQTLDGDDYGALGFGWAVHGARDIDGDGFSDVVVSGVATPHGSAQQVGEAYVFYGGPGGVDTGSPTVINGSLIEMTNFGFDITSAEINMDSYTDIIVSEYRYYNWGPPTDGRVYVFLGSASGLQTTPADVLTCPDGDFVGFGSSIANVGDFNRDGYGDVVVGAYGVSGNTGRAYLYGGRSNGLWDTPVIAFSPPNGTGGYFGWMVRGGDVNGDNYDDVIIGETDALSTSGRALVFYGYAWSRYIWFSSLPMSRSTYPVTLTGSHTGTGYFGQALTIGDYDNDGENDVVAGAPGVNSSRGRFYSFMGTASGVSSPATMYVDGTHAAGTAFAINLD